MKTLAIFFAFLVAAALLHAGEYTVEVYVVKGISLEAPRGMYEGGDVKVNELIKEADFIAKFDRVACGKKERFIRNQKTTQLPLKYEWLNSKLKPVEFRECELGESVEVLLQDSGNIPGQKVSCEFEYQNVKPSSEFSLNMRGQLFKIPTIKVEGDMNVKFDIRPGYWFVMSFPRDLHIKNEDASYAYFFRVKNL